MVGILNACNTTLCDVQGKPLAVLCISGHCKCYLTYPTFNMTERGTITQMRNNLHQPSNQPQS